MPHPHVGTGNRAVSGSELAGQFQADRGNNRRPGKAFDRTVVALASIQKNMPSPPSSRQSSEPASFRHLSDFNISAQSGIFPRVGPHSKYAGAESPSTTPFRLPPVPPPWKPLPPQPTDSFVPSSPSGSGASSTDSVRSNPGQLEPALASKGSLYGRFKRFMKQQAWKPIPEHILKNVDQPLRGKLQARNGKIARLNQLKQKVQDWKKFEDSFRKELELLSAGEPPKKGKFTIPGTGEEFVFNKKQAVAVQQKQLEKFQRAFKSSQEYKDYQEAATASADAIEERARIKESLAQEEKRLDIDIEQHFQRRESQYHTHITDSTHVRHKQVGVRNGDVSNYYQNLLVTYQEQVSDLEDELSNLSQKLDSLKKQSIPGQENQVTTLEGKLKRKKSELKAEFKSMKRKYRKNRSFENYSLAELHPLTKQLQTEKQKLVHLHQEVNSYKDNKAALQAKLKTARKTLNRVQKSSALKDTLKDIIRETRARDKEDAEAHKVVPDIIKGEKDAVRKAIKGR